MSVPNVTIERFERLLLPMDFNHIFIVLLSTSEIVRRLFSAPWFGEPTTISCYLSTVWPQVRRHRGNIDSGGNCRSVPFHYTAVLFYYRSLDRSVPFHCCAPLSPIIAPILAIHFPLICLTNAPLIVGSMMGCVELGPGEQKTDEDSNPLDILGNVLIDSTVKAKKQYIRM